MKHAFLEDSNTRQFTWTKEINYKLTIDADWDSPEKQSEVFKKPGKRPRTDTQFSYFCNQVPLLKYGGRYMEKSLDVPLFHTCNIDATLQIFIGLFRLVPAFKTHIDNLLNVSDEIKVIHRSIKAAFDGFTDAAKSCWLSLILKPDESSLTGLSWIYSNEGFNGDCEANDIDNGLEVAGKLLPVSFVYKCRNQTCTSSVCQNDADDLGFFPVSDSSTGRSMAHVLGLSIDEVLRAINGGVEKERQCDCGRRVWRNIEFLFTDPPFLFYALHADSTQFFPESKIQLRQKVKGKWYRVFAYTVLKNFQIPKIVAHYVVKFNADSQRYVYDGMNSKPYIETKFNDNHAVSSVWLIPE